jgi:hypothetical protein
MDLPESSDINIYDSLDERVALEMFLGKGIPEAVEMFRANSMLCSEALVHMGPRARLFYVRAFLIYLGSSASRGDEWAAAGLPSVANAIMESGQEVSTVRHELLEALERIHAQFTRYVPDRMTQRIYRHVPKEARKSIHALRRGVRT